MKLPVRLAAAATILAVLGGAACSPDAEKKAEPPPAAPTVVANPDIHAFRIGRIEATALKDGDLNIPVAVADNPWGRAAEVTALLTAAGQTDGVIHLPIQPLLLKDGDRIVLIDTGAGGQMGTEGKLLASLRAAGIEPGQVTDVLISHAHGDHVGGLVSNGALAFPNATIRLSAPEWADLQDQAELADLVRVITPKVQAFAPGSAVAPGITAVSLDGHTPGHSGYEIVSGDARLLYLGDALHSSVISVQRPEWRNGWDRDEAAGIATRQALLERGATQDLLIYGVHFPFPGLGRFRRENDGFVWAAGQ